MEQGKKNNLWVMLYCFVITALFSLMLLFPQSRELFAAFTASNPFLSALVKFALLAMVGELIALRLAMGLWAFPKYMVARALIWGGLGMCITVAFKIFGAGVSAMLTEGLLWGGMGRFWKAFMTSFWCNLFFAPFMMGLHKLTDAYLELKEKGVSPIGLDDIASQVNWNRFIGFAICKTIPFFWIPAHTLTFMLPGAYQTIMAAYLSIALGIILNIKRS